MTFPLLLTAVLIGPLLFGAVHTYAYTFVFLLILGTGIRLAWSGIEMENRRLSCRWTITGMEPLFIGMILLLVVQMIPIPDFLLVRISPEAKVAGDMSSAPAGLSEGWHALAPYIYPVRMSLVRWIVYGIFFFSLTRVLNSRKRIEIAIWGILILCSFEAVYGILQTYSGSGHIWWYKNIRNSAGSVDGTYLNRNHFAGLMEMGIMLAIAYAGYLFARRTGERKEGLWTKRVLALFAGAIMILGLFLSGSRGGVISAGLALVIVLIVFSFKKTQRRMNLALLLVAVLGMMYVGAAGTDYLAERFSYTGIEYENRVRYVQNTMNLISDHPLAGVGVGNYVHAFPRWQSPKNSHFTVNYAHNDWVQFAAEAGIAGLLILLAGIGYYLYSILKRWKVQQDPFSVSVGAAALGAMAVIGIHSFIDFNLHIPANFLMLAAITAIGWSALNLENPRPDLLLLKKKGAAAVVLITVLIGWSGIWTVRHFVGEAYCGTVYNATLNIDWNPPAERVRTAMAWDAGNAGYSCKLAQALMRARDAEVQQSGMDAARWHAWNPSIISALEEAARLNPWRSESHLYLGWHYSYLWNRPDYHKKWIPAADVCMERSSYMAGTSAANPHLLADLGNYWAMRSKSIDPADPGREAAWARAVWNYRKAIEMEKSKEFVAALVRQVKAYYPDEAHWVQVLP